MLRKKYSTAITGSKEGFRMKFYEKLYVGESLEKKKDTVIKKLKKKKFQLSCYIMALTENPKNQLEFFDSILLMQKKYKRENLFVVGLAGSYDEALELTKKMVEDTYRKNRDGDIRRYILEQQKDIEESRV